MKSNQNGWPTKTILPRNPLKLVGLLAAGLATFLPIKAATQLTLWDTGTHLPATADAAARSNWTSVPSQLFVFEADPAKAASDPGYYGREYSFKGDAVVENRYLTAIFWAAKGQVVIYAKSQISGDETASANGIPLGKKILEFSPLPATTPPATLRRCDVLRQAGDEVVLEVTFSTPGTANMSAVFSFGRNEIVEIKPADKMKGIRLQGPIDFGVVPSFIGDDLIFGPQASPSTAVLSLPAENVFLGLLRGEGHEFVMTWPPGKQQLKLQLGNDSTGQRVIESLDFDNDGQSLYLAAMSAPGIWHREALKPAQLEKKVPVTWKKPFAAKWKTQLTEAGVRTTYAFRDAPGQIWRGVPGSYNYPVWFEGDNAFYHLSKKVPPKGESLIYFLEGQDTPPSVSTPVDIIRATLGRPLSEPILDVAGRKLRTHHRRREGEVHRACTCGYTEAIQGIFEAGQEVTKRSFIQEAVNDMNYFVERHVERIDEYQRFAAAMTQFLRTQATRSPELKPYLETLEQITQQIPEEYSVQKENMKSPEHARELTQRTMALTQNKSPKNVPAFMELLKAWRAMGGAQDYVIAQCHTITRKLFQEAGYGSVDNAKAVAVAQEIRTRCRQVLRNPDGYEIWAEY